VPYWKRLAVGALVAAGAVFALVAANIATGDPLERLDALAAHWVHAQRTPALTSIMRAVSHAHAPGPICAYAALMAIFLIRRRERYWLLGLMLAVPLGLLLNVTLKHLFQRARPVLDEPLLSLATYAFPSGHTAGATLFYGVLAAYLVAHTRALPVLAAWVAGWVSLVALVAFSRVYLGAHYLTDVVAAAAWSLAWLALCLLGVHRLHLRAGPVSGEQL
jgi:undecaprenyl-diphosphatase